MWCMRMLKLTGNVRYGDMAERIMYNAGISGASLDMKTYFYSNPLAYSLDAPIKATFGTYKHKAARRFHTHDCWCCPPQLFRTFASMARWVFGEGDNTLRVNFFADCDYESDFAKLGMRTRYPWDGRVTIKTDRASGLRLRIRIPAWCQSPTVNGQPVAAGSYFDLTVNSGDKVAVELPMQPVWMQANPNVEAARGMLAAVRGPVVYCTEGCDNETPLSDIYIDPGQAPEVSFEPDLLGGVVALHAKAAAVQPGQALYFPAQEPKTPVQLKMISYYAWANRADCDMSVWLPRL